MSEHDDNTTASDREAPQAPLPHGEGAAWLAGEASGDFLASLVLPEVARRMDWAPQFGVGGQKMIAAGLESWYPASRLSVRGYVEVLKKLPGILMLRRAMIRRVLEVNPRVFIGVDAPDFNLGVEAKLKAQGLRTVHFVSPSIWAWRPERIHKIRAAVDRMLLVFPFEEEIYKRENVPATYIGHPLASIIPMKPDTEGARAKLGIQAKGEPVFAVLPGSRKDEIFGCGPVFFEACERVIERLGAGRFVVPAVDAHARVDCRGGQHAPAPHRAPDGGHGQVPRGFGGRRRRACRQRHGGPRSGPVQKAHGGGLRDAGPLGAHHEGQGPHPLREPAQHFGRPRRCARIPALLLHPRCAGLQPHRSAQGRAPPQP